MNLRIFFILLSSQDNKLFIFTRNYRNRGRKTKLDLLLFDNNRVSFTCQYDVTKCKQNQLIARSVVVESVTR